MHEALQFLGTENVLDKDSVLSIEGKSVLAGVRTDGPTVNTSEHKGLKGWMQRALLWLFWGWCYAHQLELACKVAISIVPCSL